MKMDGNKSTIWRNEEDQFKYYSLIRLIQDSPSSNPPISVFVGGGLSIQAGYPSTNELIEHLITSAKLDPLEFSSIDKFPIKAKHIKEKIENQGGNFYETLYKRFDENYNKLHRTIPLYQDLLRAPFRSFITTNYDSCIEEAAELLSVQLDDIQVYPDLRPDNLQSRNLYHIHGKIDLDDVPNSSRSIILTNDDYDIAYSEISKLPIFLSAIFDSHNILFIGFSLEEETLDKILELSRRRNDHLKRHQGRHSNKSIPYKFAILPIERKRIDLSKVSDEEITNYQDTIRRQDQDLLDNCGIITIRYQANEIYSEIKTIVRDITDNTRIRASQINFDLENTGVSV